MLFRVVHLSAEHSTQTDGVITDVDVFLNLADPLGYDLAHLEGHEHAQGLQVPPELLPDLPDNLPPMWGRDLSPDLPRLLAGPHTAVIILHSARDHLGDGLTIGGAQRGHNLSCKRKIVCFNLIHIYLSGSFPFAVKHTQVLILEAEVLEELVFAALVDQEAGGARGGAEAESGGQEARH